MNSKLFALHDKSFPIACEMSYVTHACNAFYTCINKSYMHCTWLSNNTTMWHDYLSKNNNKITTKNTITNKATTATTTQQSECRISTQQNRIVILNNGIYTSHAYLI